MSFTNVAQLPWLKAIDTSSAKTFATKPRYQDLPVYHGLRVSWEYFGREDELGTINFATPARTAAAAVSEIKTGICVPLNLPIQIPAHPSFGRIQAEHTVTRRSADRPVNDDVLLMNTQSGTQVDGLRHYGCMAGKCYYNGHPMESVALGRSLQNVEGPLDAKNDDIRLGVHNWSCHGIQGRGVLIDMVSYYTRDGAALPYDPWRTHAVSLEDLKAAATHQGVIFQPGDHLLIRMGFTQKFYNATAAERAVIVSGEGMQFAGIDSHENTAEWIWTNEFASIGADVPALESWPPAAGTVFLHERVIAGFGSPIGEFFDLERLSEVCKAQKRWTFFYAANLLNLLGGCASTANATATF